MSAGNPGEKVIDLDAIRARAKAAAERHTDDYQPHRDRADLLVLLDEARSERDELLENLRPAIYALWDVRYPNVDEGESFNARVGVNNVLMEWLYEHHKDYLEGLNVARFPAPSPTDEEAK